MATTQLQKYSSSLYIGKYIKAFAHAWKNCLRCFYSKKWLVRKIAFPVVNSAVELQHKLLVCYPHKTIFVYKQLQFFFPVHMEMMFILILDILSDPLQMRITDRDGQVIVLPGKLPL